MAGSALLCGVAEIDITPPMGVEMCGYGPYEKRVCTEILDPLYARALWFQKEDNATLIITVDLCAISLAIRNEVAQEIHRQTGIPESNILIGASHTHSGPAVRRMIGWGECDAGYLARLPQLLIAVAKQAQERATPAKVGATRHRVHGIGVNREQAALGPLDTAAQLLRVDRADGTPLAALFNIGVHGVARYPFTSRISADWPGLAAAFIKASMPPAVGMFLQGCLGNINAHEMSFARDDVTLRQQVADMRAGDVAMRFCEQTLPALQAIETQPDAEIKSAFAMIKLPCILPDEHKLQQTIAENLEVAERMTIAQLRPLHERLADETEAEKAWRQARFNVDAARRQLELAAEGKSFLEAPVQVLQIGDAALVGWPGEIFVELGLELRQRSPFPLTFVAGFANDTVGYVPTEAAYESQGQPNQYGVYPTYFTPLIYNNLPFEPRVGRVLIEETLQLLRRMHG